MTGAPTALASRPPRASTTLPAAASPAALQGDEVRWLLGACLVTLALCGLPAAVAAALGRPDLERSGTFWFVRDFSQYQAAMHEAARERGWLIHNHFTAEPHAPALLYPLYVLLGHLAAVTRVAPEALFTALEWLGRVALVPALYAFAATFLPRPKARRLALLLTLGTMGLAGWEVPARLLTGATGAAPAGLNPYLEFNTFGVLLAAPHIMLGLALTLLAAPLYLRAASAPTPGRLAALAIAALALAAVHPFNLPVLASTLLAEALLRPRAERRLALLAALAACAAAAPLALYNLLLFQADPFWSGTYGSQNRMPAPPPWALPVDVGLVLLAAPLAWHALRGWPPERRRLLLLWVGLCLVWLYTPLPYQRRFAFGVQPALAVLAATGLLAANAWMRERAWGPLRRRVVNYGVALAALMTSVLVYAALLVSAATNAPTELFLWSRAEAAAGRWLAADGSSAADVALASPEYANPLAGILPGRVVYGHPVATLRAEEKRALVRRFYAAESSPAERATVLEASGATLVALGPRERRLGATSLDGVPGLDLVYDRDGVRWYRVRRAG